MRKRTKFGKATSCPCGKSKKFCPIIENGRATNAGKCFSQKCGQQFIPLSTSRAKSLTVHSAPTQRRDHVYTTANGDPHMRVAVERKPDGSKNVFQQRWENNQWKNGLNGIQLLPYRLPEVLERIALDGIVAVVEGERDADVAATIGICATTNPMGALKWHDELSLFFEGAMVVVIPDNDDVGHQHAEQVKQSLLVHGVRNVAILDLTQLMPTLPAKGDLTDYMQLGGDPEQLRRMIDDLVREDVADDDKSLLTPPNISDADLPATLRSMMQGLTDPYQRLSLLMASITVLGSVMPRVTIRYGNRDLAPTLYLLVVGPPGSGKGAILPAMLLAERIDQVQGEEYRQSMKAHRILEEQHRAGNRDQTFADLDAPIRRRLLVPSDATAPVIIRALCQNSSILVFDSEADTLATAMRSDTGDASSAFRKAWHGERVSHARAGGDVNLATSHPRLSMVLSGTLDQVQALTSHASNGLVSRFAFIEVPRQRRFRDPFSAEGFPSEQSARDLQNHVYDLWRANAQRSVDDGYRVELTASQRARFLQHYRDRYDDDIMEADDAVTLRSGINVVRIATILTAIRRWDESQRLDPLMLATDLDFELALTIGEYLRLGTDRIVAGIEKVQSNSILKPRKRKVSQWLEQLPPEFRTADAIAVAKRHGISRSRVFDNLNNDRWFENVRHGVWRKVA